MLTGTLTTVMCRELAKQGLETLSEFDGRRGFSVRSYGGGDGGGESSSVEGSLGTRQKDRLWRGLV